MSRLLAEFCRLDGEPITEAVGWWFTGFVDGEGCFSIEPKRCEFIVKLRDDDRALLELVQDALGIGRIGREMGPGGNRRPQARWVVSKKRDLIWLTELLDRYPLQSKKANDYGVWREAVIQWYCGSTRHLGAYRKELQMVREYRVRVSDATKPNDCLEERP